MAFCVLLTPILAYAEDETPSVQTEITDQGVNGAEDSNGAENGKDTTDPENSVPADTTPTPEPTATGTASVSESTVSSSPTYAHSA